MTERWVKATVPGGPEFWINVATITKMERRTGERDDYTVLTGRHFVTTSVEPPEHFIPDQDLSFHKAIVLIQSIAAIPPERAHGPGIVRDARRFMKWPEDAP
jgi:hypothetical protein